MAERGRMRADDSNDRASVQGKDPTRHQSRPDRDQSVGLRCALLCLAASGVFPSPILAGPLDQLSDLTDKAAQAVITLKSRDNFNSEYLYDVSVKNLSSDLLVGESLVVVLDKITNIGGNEWASGTSESNLSRVEILGQDGETDEGKPYFRIPRGPGPDLLPYTESSPASVRIRNKDYLIVFTPFFRVYGMKRTPTLPKAKDRVLPRPPAQTPSDRLIQMLIQKGVLSEEEGRSLYQP
ncbi:MAG: hypothetical protein OEW32_05860 [Nitrospira sp.]|nr:hypothetical protein [Nitrospira sp.]